MMGWQCHQLNHMHIIETLLQTDNHATLANAQQTESIEGKQICTELVRKRENQSVMERLIV